MESIYPASDPIGERIGLSGASLVGYMSGDQLHPPMVDDKELWATGRWQEAAQLHVLEAARFARVERAERILDIGAGIGGPARLLVDEYGASVYAVTNAPNMVASARRLNAENPRWESAIEIVEHDCQRPYARGQFDCAMSLNMWYQVPDKRALLENAHEALRPGGRILIEDWALTEVATNGDAEALGEHFAPGQFVREADVPTLFDDAGFRVVGRQDLSHVGRTHMRRWFQPVFDEQIRPRIERDWPEWGSALADDFAAAVETCVRLYGDEKLRYLRTLGIRS